MPHTEAWWVCSKCCAPVIKVGRKRVTEAMRDHREVCDPTAGYSMQQVPQKKT